MRIDQREKSIDEFRAFEIADLPKGDFATQMIVAVGVTARAFEGTFAGNLNRQGRTITAKDSPPRGDNAFHLPTITKRIRTDVESREYAGRSVWPRRVRCTRNPSLNL